MPEDQSPPSAELLSLLEWYCAAGVDLAVGDEPVNRFALARPAQARVQAAAPAQPAPALLEADPGAARALAASAVDLDTLRSTLDAYEGCALKHRATQLVFEDGNRAASIMLVGEAPGQEEDLKGKPFVGRAGRLLDLMLGAIGLDRTQVYLANTVPWRPPGNRNPTPQEVALCLPFLHRQIELVAPKILVTIGATATQTLFDTKVGISRLRGQWRDLGIGPVQMQAMPTLHPAFLLRQPAQKQQAWKDLLSLREKIDSLEI
jgi:uracil-DNA glycosylase